LETTPPSAAVPPQSCPSTTLQFAGPEGGLAPQTPRFAPAAFAQVPVQQSPATAQLSPAWPQKDDGWHVPLLHSPEQHWALVVQTLPCVLQVVFSAAHAPLVHFWLQQLPSLVQAPRSEVHVG
jgi:hypothetical protein